MAAGKHQGQPQTRLGKCSRADPRSLAAIPVHPPLEDLPCPPCAMRDDEAEVEPSARLALESSIARTLRLASIRNRRIDSRQDPTPHQYHLPSRRSCAGTICSAGGMAVFPHSGVNG
jgi:hypothetical protein